MRYYENTIDYEILEALKNMPNIDPDNSLRLSFIHKKRNKFLPGELPTDIFIYRQSPIAKHTLKDGSLDQKKTKFTSINNRK